MSSPSSASVAAPAVKICFNTHCKESVSDHQSPRRRGWPLRSREIAELCDRCSSAFEQGTFCETFHSNDSGWRNCETCGKRVHCGCIVSAQTYVFLDAGGVECIACARKSLTMQHVPERRDSPAKTWRSIATPLSGQWRQAPHMWNMTMQSDLQQRLSYEFDRPSSIEKLAPGGRHSISAHEKKFEPERKISTNLNISQEKYTRRNTGENDPMSIRKSITGDPCSTSSLVNFEAKPNSSIKLQQLPVSKENSSLLIGLPASFSSSNGVKDPMNLSANQPPAQVTTPLSKQFYPQRMNEVELQVQMRNGRTRVDAYPRTQLLPRYWPRITNQELQQISGEYPSIFPQSSITPLFEKMLSASDAGRIGRLVLPKKCAEAYFPAISQPEGLPLKVQDASGKDWVFQFRFWPNNNSRMYVLEGVTPCIQAMQLQAGDTVTFSRIDPEGKLVMGFRKASNSSTEQDPETHKSSSEISPPPEADQITSLIRKDGSTAKLLQVPSKRKAKTLGSKNNRLRIENEESMELKLTWEEAQKLLRAPPNSSPSIVVIEGHEFEEYEEAPVLGKKTYLTSDQTGESHQWVRCEECLKWRRVPVDALLPFKWICLENVWDPERSSCSSAQELSLEQIADMVSCKSGVLKKGKAKAERDSVEVSDRLDTLANLAILGYSKSLQSSQPTTRHPRHKPGCTCIVCIQPPSGKGPKHKPHCTCNVCLTVKRRFRTLELRREKRQSEKESETPGKQKSPILPSEGSPQPRSMDVASTGPSEVATQKVDMSKVAMVVHEASDHRTSASPLKTRQIDLNIQPEREEEPLTQHQSVTLVPY